MRFGERNVLELGYKELKKREKRIPYHKVYKYMVETGKMIPNPNKQRKRKRCRYERGHTFSLVYGYWHRTTEEHPHEKFGLMMQVDLC